MIDLSSFPAPAEPVAHQHIEWKEFELNRMARRLVVAGRPMTLRLKEYELLEIMLQRPEKCFSRDELLRCIWGYDFDTGTNLVDALVYSVRKKLRRHVKRPIIETVRGVGYRLAGS